MTGEISPAFISPREFGRLAEFIEGYTGIRMPSSKMSLIEGRLRKRLRLLGLDSFDDYCRYLFDEGGLPDELTDVIDAVTTNKTEFFRESPHFDFLTERALPSLLNDAGRRGQPIRAWSAAASSGAEAYSIAMAMADILTQQPASVDFSVFATDICVEMLKKGARGVYGFDELTPVPARLRKRFFRDALDPSRREARIVPTLRRKVRFGHLNLMDDTYAMPKDMDMIFCRNVLIYFDHKTQSEVVRKLCRHLRPGGYLFLGHTETHASQNQQVRAVSNAVFVREDGGMER